jgi:RND family efflux transporter MFP subunit
VNSPSPPAAARRVLRWSLLGAALVAAALYAFWSVTQRGPGEGAVTAAATATAPKNAASARPALTVALVRPTRENWPRTLAAQGNIAAWQEAVVGGELSGFRIVEVLVNVGDRVRKGQTLARVNAQTVATDVAQARASLAEAEAVLAEARSNAVRSRDLAEKGFVSSQAATQTATAEQTAVARLAAARARLQAEEVRLAQTQVLAPDDGTISARSATVGSLAQPGQELFRLIRGNRLEWRAEVTAGEIAHLAPGLSAVVRLPGGESVAGKVRMIAPTVDAQTRNAIVYVDLPVDGRSPARAGMFARGEFDLGAAAALTLPQSAVVQRDGFAYAFRIDGGGRAAQTKISVGRRVGDRIEVTGGLPAEAQVVAAGAGFLADGDVLRVVPADPAAPPLNRTAP